MNYRAYVCLFSIVAVSIIGVPPSYLAAQNVWIETTQEDFRDGFFDRDIYASQRDGGTVEFSLRWDLNNDEYIDIPMARNFGGLSYVYWGSASGYSYANMSVYPQTDCGECAIADVNHDGYPELFFVSGYNYVRMFYGTATGPDPYNYNTINIPLWNKSCFIADYNKDGIVDIPYIIDRYSDEVDEYPIAGIKKDEDPGQVLFILYWMIGTTLFFCLLGGGIALLYKSKK